ncbi:MAG: ABC transporter permease [Chlamydiota bacterium]
MHEIDPLFSKSSLEESFKQPSNTIPRISYWQDAWRRIKINKFAIASLICLSLLTLMAVIGPMLSSYTYYDTHLHLKNIKPCSLFLFGTDELGRDIFTRIWCGARISLFVGVSAAFIDMVIGVFYGAFSGLMGGKIDEFLMRFADILYSLPYLLVVILLIVIMGPGLTTMIISITLTGWINMARLVRAQILQLKTLDFVLAAHSLGASKSRILIKHLIPNTMGSIITTLTLTIPTAIFAEAFLSFLGLGIQAPIASWGTMANDGLSALRYYPWRLFFPAFFISLTMLCFNLIGDSLRDALDPRIRS